MTKIADLDEIDTTSFTAAFGECDQGFQAEIAEIAATANLHPLIVFALWSEYSEICSTCDQSAVLFEFQKWYVHFLTPINKTPLGPSIDIDALVRRETAFGSMDELVNASGGYRPSLYIFKESCRLIADEYDRIQHGRNDTRRAFRHTR